MSKSLKVGILDDMADFSGRDDESSVEMAAAGRIPADLAGWIEREIGVLRQAGRFDAEVEFLHAYALGLPSGTAEAVEQAYRQLADAGACLIVGPAIGDNALAATPLASSCAFPRSTGPPPGAPAAAGCSSTRSAATRTNRSSSPGTWPRSA
jgi:hypothetical protein